MIIIKIKIKNKKDEHVAGVEGKALLVEGRGSGIDSKEVH